MIVQDSWGSDSGYRGRWHPSLHRALLEEAFCLRQAWAGIHGEAVGRGAGGSLQGEKIAFMYEEGWTGQDAFRETQDGSQ